MNRSAWGRAGVGVSAVGLLVGLLLFGRHVVAVFPPERAPPELRHREAPERTLATRTDWESEEGGCRLQVTVVDDREQPQPGALVELWDRKELSGGEVVLDGTTDAWGEVLFEELPCSPRSVHVSARGGEGTASLRHLVRLSAGTLAHRTLVAEPTLRISGQLVSSSGARLSHASLVLNYAGGDHSVAVDEEGAFRAELPVPREADSKLVLRGDAFGHGSTQEILPLAYLGSDGRWSASTDVHVGGEDLTGLELELRPRREVRVHCLGLPNDRCEGVLLTCTAPWSPIGSLCLGSLEDEPAICGCHSLLGPDLEGDVAVRGNGLSTLVGPEETDAWLDFRDGGRIVGRVTGDGGAVENCTASALRVPADPLDARAGLMVASAARCASDGSFELAGLGEGDWQLSVFATVPGVGERERLFGSLQVRGSDVDVGTVEMLDGGSVEGRVMDGVTGEPVEQSPVLAVGGRAGASRSSVLTTRTDEEGRFRWEGLPPGQWTLRLLEAPHSPLEVEVEDGAITDVVMETAEASALEINGFSLVTDDGQLVVDEVDSEGPAAAAGMRAGDRVVAVELGFIDVSSAFGSRADAVAHWLIGHWGGPGMSVVLDRDGERLKVPLEW